jgi:hypothetical protein
VINGTINEEICAFKPGLSHTNSFGRFAILLRAAIFLAAPWILSAQLDFQQNGYVEYRGFGFPQTAYNDKAHIIGEAIIRYDVVYGLAPGWKLKGGTETRSDTHRQAEREFRLNIDDRGLRRPNFSIRRVSLMYTRGRFTAEAGKQLIRWGKTDILNPTDRFAPRDYLAVVDNDVLAVTAARVQYEGGSNKLEIVAQPVFTPSRAPLLNQRWTVLPQPMQPVTINDQGSRIPGGTQWGARWSHSGDSYDMSLSFFDGRNHLPLLEGNYQTGQIDFRRFFPRMRMYGADVAVPLGWLTFKAESAYFTSTTKEADEYVLYVLQVGREVARWSFCAGYAGEAVTRNRNQWNFAPDRGLAGGFLGRAKYNIDAKRTVTFESAARTSGLWLRSEYSESWGPNWGGTVGFTLLRGEPTDFLGQYRRNSFFNLSLRYSF